MSNGVGLTFRSKSDALRFKGAHPASMSAFEPVRWLVISQSIQIKALTPIGQRRSSRQKRAKALMP